MARMCQPHYPAGNSERPFGASRASNRPGLNIMDMPEARLHHARQGQPRQSGRVDKSMLTSVVEVIREDSHEPAACASDETPPPCSEEDQSKMWPVWTCPKCTYINAGVMFCEMCVAPYRQTAHQHSTDSRNTIEARLLKEDWPSPFEASEKAWEACEVSSVGSSWLDVADLDEVALDKVDSTSEGFTFVEGPNVGTQTARSWAELAASDSGQHKTMVRCSGIMPPLWRQPKERQEKTKVTQEEEDNNTVLDLLEARRLQPVAYRGFAQRGIRMRRRR